MLRLEDGTLIVLPAKQTTMPNPAGSPVQQPPSSNQLDKDLSAAESWSGADSENDFVGSNDSSARALKRKRPLTVSYVAPAEETRRPNDPSSCELCKQRKVKCDRMQPSCGWCTRNGQRCEYKERKKPGLRAGYGKELEQRLGKPQRSMRGVQV